MDLEQEFECTIKLLIVGDSGVGKTNFIYRFITGKFIQSHMATTGIDLKTTIIEIKGKKIRIQLWDTAGQEKYKSITKNLFLKVQGILVVYDITNEMSFKNLKSWVQMIKEDCGEHTPIIILGNKSDLEENRVVNKNDAMAYAEEEKVLYLETSPKTGENVQNSINIISEKVLENSETGNDFSFTLDSSLIKKKKKHKCCK